MNLININGEKIRTELLKVGARREEFIDNYKRCSEMLYRIEEVNALGYFKTESRHLAENIRKYYDNNLRYFALQIKIADRIISQYEKHDKSISISIKGDK